MRELISALILEMGRWRIVTQVNASATRSIDTPPHALSRTLDFDDVNACSWEYYAYDLGQDSVGLYSVFHI